MASMRNGSGDEWWCVFHADGWAALKGLAHESEAWARGGESLSAALQAVLPRDLGDFASEPAFRWEETSFAYFHLPARPGWVRANDRTAYAALEAGDEWLLRHLSGGPEDYAAFAEDYYERTVPLESVIAVFGHAPMTEHLVASLNPSITLSDIAPELYAEIGYERDHQDSGG